MSLNPMLGPDGDEIILIEYGSDNDPHAVFTTRRCYDMRVDKDGRVWYDYVGGGGSPYMGRTDGTWRGKFWSKPGIKIRAADGKCDSLTDEQLVEMGFDRVAEPINGNPFDDAGDGVTVYCSVCKADYGVSNFDDSGHRRHMRRLESTWYGPGACHGGNYDVVADDHKAEFLTVLSAMPVQCVRDFRDALMLALDYDKSKAPQHAPLHFFAPYQFRVWGSMIGPGTIDAVFHIPGRRGYYHIEESDFDGLIEEHEEHLQVGFAWLLGLSTGYGEKVADTKEADAITLQWVEEFLAEFAENEEMQDVERERAAEAA